MANFDQTKGKAKRAAGDLTGDRGLQREGKADIRAGKVKSAVDDVAGKAKNIVDKIKVRLTKH